MTSAPPKRLTSIALWAALILAPAGAALAQPAPTAGELDQIVSQFKAHGLAPVGKHGFLQSIRWVEQSVAAERSTVTLVSATGRTDLKLGADLTLDLDSPLATRTEAPLAFIGYGLPTHAGGASDFAGQDLRGKVLVALDGAPAGLTDSDAARIRQAAAQQAMEQAGAVGLITISIGKDGTVTATDASGFYIDAKPADAAQPAFAAAFNPAAAEKLFDRSGHSFAEVAALARAHRPLTGFALNKTLTANLQTQKRGFEEVAALATVAGSDPSLKNDYVVVAARLTPAETSSTIEGLLPSDGAKPRRPILYAAFRERNRHNATARALLAQNIQNGTVAAVFSIRPDVAIQTGANQIQLGGARDSSLGAAAQQLAAARHLAVAPEGFSTADDLSPPDSPLLALSRPDATAGAAQQVNFDSYAAALIRGIADAPDRPQWAPGSQFAPPEPTRIEDATSFVFQMPVGRQGQRLISGTV